MDPIKFIKELRDACDKIITAYENGDMQAFMQAQDEFMLLMIKAECIK